MQAAANSVWHDVKAASDLGATVDALALYNRQHGDLWLKSIDELDALFDQAKLAEAAGLLRAVELIGLKPSKSLADTLESEGFYWDRAAARIEREAEAAGLEIPPDADRILNPRWDDPPANDLPMSEDVAGVQRAHSAAADDDLHMLASEMGWALRDVREDDIRAVLAGEGPLNAQAAMATLRLGYERMGDLGVEADKIPGRIAGAMVKNGVNRATAIELTELMFDALRRGGTPTIEPPKLNDLTQGVKFDLGDGKGERKLSEISDDLDAFDAGLKAIKDCL